MNLVNLGLPKSGTTTLHTALARSGLRSAHWKVKHRIVGRNLYHHHLAGRDPLTDLAEYDVITQADFISEHRSYWPQMDAALVHAIASHHPECRFLLLTRPVAKIADSIMRWRDLSDRLEALGAPGLPPGHAGEIDALTTWIDGHFRNVRRWFKDDPRFLELDIEDPEAPNRLGQFLRVEIAWWGMANTNAEAA